jgi:SAM-dependent methyltransferase
MDFQQTQARYFDAMADRFQVSVPAALEARHADIVARAGVGATSKVLDVASGKGVLIQHFLNQGVPPSNIVACDVSAKMLSHARDRYKSHPEIAFLHKSVEDLLAAKDDARGPRFSHIFLNGCFGNFRSPDEVLLLAGRACSSLISISHPLGADFVRWLNAQEPEIVPHRLPDATTLPAVAERARLRVRCFHNEPGFYLAQLEPDPATRI